MNMGDPNDAWSWLDASPNQAWARIAQQKKIDELKRDLAADTNLEVVKENGSTKFKVTHIISGATLGTFDCNTVRNQQDSSHFSLEARNQINAEKAKIMNLAESLTAQPATVPTNDPRAQAIARQRILYNDNLAPKKPSAKSGAPSSTDSPSSDNIRKAGAILGRAGVNTTNADARTFSSSLSSVLQEMMEEVRKKEHARATQAERNRKIAEDAKKSAEEIKRQEDEFKKNDESTGLTPFQNPNKPQ